MSIENKHSSKNDQGIYVMKYVYHSKTKIYSLTISMEV